MVSSAAEHQVIRLAPGDYGDMIIDKKIVILGTDGGGSCAPPLGQGGPRFGQLTLKGGARGAGFSAGSVSISDGGEAHRFTTRGGDTCLDVTDGIASGLAAFDCEVGVRAGPNATVSQAVIASNRSHGVISGNHTRLDYVTIANNGGDGFHATAGDWTLTNAVVVDNSGWAVWSNEPPLMGHGIAMFGNGAGGYGSDHPSTALWPVSKVERPFMSRQLMGMLPGDRYTNIPPVATEGLIRVDWLRQRPWDKPEGPAESGMELVARYTPNSPLNRARHFDAMPTHDALGQPRRPDTRMGAVESSDWTDPGTPLYVDATTEREGDGSAEAPFRHIQDAMAAADQGQIIRVLPGLYKESVYITETDVWLIGGRRIGGEFVAFDDPTDPNLPVIDPSETGAPAHGIYLDSVSHLTRVQGLAVQNAYTAITVIMEEEHPPSAPVLRSLRMTDNRKGFDTDETNGRIENCRVADNRIGLSFRSVATWSVTDTVIEDNGLAATFNLVMADGTTDFEFRGNTFTDNGGVHIDSIASRHGRKYLFEGNIFENTDIVVHSGFKGTTLEITDNDFSGTGHIVLAGAAYDTPHIQVTNNRFPEAEPIEVQGDGYTDVIGPNLDHKPSTPPALQPPPDDPVGPHASPIALDAVRGRVYAVGADFDGLGVFDADTGDRLHFVKVGSDPRGVALTPNGSTLLVANMGSGTVSVIDADTLSVSRTVAVGVEPFGIAVDPTGTWAYVSLSGDEGLVQLRVADGTIERRVRVAGKPRGLAIWTDRSSRKLFVTHFAPQRDPGEPEATLASLRPIVTVLDLPGLTNARQIILPPVESGTLPAAAPTLMQSAVPRGDRIYLPSFGATPEQPTDLVKRDRPLMQFETTVQALLTVLDARTESPIEGETANLSSPGQPFNGPYGIAFDDGTAFIAMYGNDGVARFELGLGQPPRVVDRWRSTQDLATGVNPRGIVVDTVRKLAYTVNFSSGNLSVLDYTQNAEVARTPLGPRSADRLTQTARWGKEWFYTTNRVASAANFWIACATCHPDGRSDGVTWAFPQGPRSTPHIAGSPHTTPLHFDGDRDELDDFEHTIRDLQGGFSLVNGPIPPEVGDPLIPMDTPWDYITEYVLSGVDAPRAPGSIGGEESGRRHFRDLGCTSCHGGPWFTLSRMPAQPTIVGRQVTDTLRNVGTRTDRDTVGDGAFDPPTLWGVGQTAPYLHDGQAPDLMSVFANPTHLYAGLAVPPREALTAAQLNDLAAFVRSIDSRTPPVDDAMEPNDSAASALAPPNPDSVLVALGQDWWTANGDIEVSVAQAAQVDPVQVRITNADDDVAFEGPAPMTWSSDHPDNWWIAVSGHGQAYQLSVQ